MRCLGSISGSGGAGSLSKIFSFIREWHLIAREWPSICESPEYSYYSASHAELTCQFSAGVHQILSQMQWYSFMRI